MRPRRAPLQRAPRTPSSVPPAASLSVQVVPRPRPAAGERTAGTAPPAHLGFVGRPPAPTLPPVHPGLHDRRSGEALPETIDLPLVAVRRAAEAGVRSPAAPLPFAERIQQSFGAFDLHGVRAHLGGEASASARSLGARAYATGGHVVFAGRPDLFTAAHEAAHVIQQRAGARPAGGIDRPGDPHERNADAVAAQVVAGRPAGHLLASYAQRPGGPPPGPHHPSSGAPVQRKVGLEIESLIPVHEAEDNGPGKNVQSGRKIVEYLDLKLVTDHAGQFRGFPGGSGIVEYQTPARPEGEINKVLEDVGTAGDLTQSIVDSLKTSFSTAMEVDGKKSAVMKPSTVGDAPDDKLELGLKDATQAQIDAIDGSGRFQINIGVPASAVYGVFGVGATALLRGEQTQKARRVYGLIQKTASTAIQLARSLGLSPQKDKVDFDRAVGFLTLLLQHLVAPGLLPVGEHETEKQHFAFLPKTPLHLVFNSLPDALRQALAGGRDMILKAVAEHEVKPETSLYSDTTVDDTLTQILGGTGDPVVASVIDSAPLPLEEAGDSKEAPVLETRHIRGPRVAPGKWAETAGELLAPLLKAIAGKT